MIRLTTLGEIRIARDGQGDLPLASQQPKRIALLAYLTIARPRGAHRRDSLLALLWPELDQDRGRAALRQALHSIRKALAEEASAGESCIVSTGLESIEIDRHRVGCDVIDFEAAAASGDHERALLLYGRGDFLHGLFVPDAPEFERWLDGERARLREIARTGAWAAADAAHRAARAGDVVRHVRFALALSELDEAAHRRGMQLLGAAGERAIALDVYRRFADELRRELDTEPSDATRALAESLRIADATHPVFPAGSSSIAPAGHTTTENPVRPPGAAPVRRRIGRRAAAAWIVSIIGIGAAARLAPSSALPLDPRTVHVAEFSDDRRGTDSEGQLATRAVRDALVRLDNVRIESPDENDAQGSASARAGTLVRGSARINGDSLEWRAEVVDRVSETIARILTTRVARSASSDVRRRSLDDFTERVSAAVATHLYPGWGTSLSQPPSYAAYRLFLDGMRSIKGERHDEAAASFRRAYAEDSTFTVAGLLAGSEYYQTRRYAAADSIVTALRPKRALLPPVDAALLDWLDLSLRGDRFGARGAMERVVALVPTADLAWLQLAIDNVETARPREAIGALDRIESESAFGEAWASYWATRIEALHLLGEHRGELSVAREGLRRHPELRVLAGYELRALAALGKIDEVRERVSALSSRPLEVGVDAPTISRQAAQELAAHGHPDDAREILDMVRSWYESRRPTAGSESAARMGYARTLYLTNDYRARAIYDSVFTANPRCTDCLGLAAIGAARAGDHIRADSLVGALSGQTRPYLFGRHLLWQARTAATLGDLVAARSLLAAAFEAGLEFDVTTHTDPDLMRINPDSVYRAFARAPEK